MQPHLLLIQSTGGRLESQPKGMSYDIKFNCCDIYSRLSR